MLAGGKGGRKRLAIEALQVDVKLPEAWDVYSLRLQNLGMGRVGVNRDVRATYPCSFWSVRPFNSLSRLPETRRVSLATAQYPDIHNQDIDIIRIRPRDGFQVNCSTVKS